MTNRTLFISLQIRKKLDDFLDLETPASKKECQMICGTAAQLKKVVPGMQLMYPGMQALCSPNVKFKWNEDLEMELQELKKALKHHIKLSPIDIRKNLILIIDAASTIGCSYLLLQMKNPDREEDGYNFISCDSSNF